MPSLECEVCGVRWSAVEIELHNLYASGPCPCCSTNKEEAGYLKPEAEPNEDTVTVAPTIPPCKACPWVSNQQRDLVAINQPQVKAAALAGQMFVCHVRMGECQGIKIFREKETGVAK